MVQYVDRTRPLVDTRRRQVAQTVGHVMLDHMSSSGVMHGDGRRRGKGKHEVKEKDIAAVHARYRNTVELVANRWETIIPRPTDNLPTHIKGAAEWVDYNKPNRSCYVVRSPGNAAEEWLIELINGEWYLLTWENTGWRTKASGRLNEGDRQNLRLGWFNITDAEHPDFHPLFVAPQVQEEETMIIRGASKDKGKRKASRPPSTDIHSPRDPEPAVKDKSEPSEEERELSEESLSKRPDTPMPGEWG